MKTSIVLLYTLFFCAEVLHSASAVNVGPERESSGANEGSGHRVTTNTSSIPTFHTGSLAAPALRVLSLKDRKHDIDSIWGPGLPTLQKLALFDKVWGTLDSSYASFHDLEINWDSLGTALRAEISGGVSRGRFAGLMNHLLMRLRDPHTYIRDTVVNVLMPIDPRLPLFAVGGWGEQGHFGAGLTPMSDGSLLVYKVAADHPLGLVPGDLVLGYDRVPWREQCKRIMEAQIPIARASWPGSCPSAYEHSMLINAGMNWHLFDSIDIVKWKSGDTVHLSTQLLRGKTMQLTASEQLDVPGIEWPTSFNTDPVSYGIISGTNVGYIYVWGWTGNARDKFLEAVSSLMLTEGMIIDFRFNIGGNMFMSDPAFERLFATDIPTIDFARRCSPADHFPLCATNNPGSYVIHGTDPGYTQPIAVLCGPGALSSGDQVALRMKFHPHARLFGKSTTAAFNSPSSVDVGQPEWAFRTCGIDAYLLSQPGKYLTRNELKMDTTVWLTRSTVAMGRDNVVDAAMNWISTSLSDVKGIPSAVESAHHFVLTPNPANEFIVAHSSSPFSENSRIEIYSALGMKVATRQNYSLSTTSFDCRIDISSLAPGSYSVQIRGLTGVVSTGFIVAR